MKDKKNWVDSMASFTVSSLHYYLKQPFQFLTILLYTQASVVSGLTPKENALKHFGDCLEENLNQLEVRDLIDFYRIRGIPKECCSSLAEELIPSDIINLPGYIDPTNCRVNAFFVPKGIFDPHNHPLEFVSHIVSGGYSHTILEEISASVSTVQEDICHPCHPALNEVCAEHSRIYTESDTIRELGTVKLSETNEEYFSKGEFVKFDSTDSIHRIDHFEKDTMTVNYISAVGDKIIDVFVSHETPNRAVLSKADTRTPLSREASVAILSKSILFFKPAGSGAKNITVNNDSRCALTK